MTAAWAVYVKLFPTQLSVCVDNSMASSPERKSKQAESQKAVVQVASKLRASLSNLPSVTLGYRSTMAICLVFGFLAAVVSVASSNDAAYGDMSMPHRGNSVASGKSSRMHSGMSSRASAPAPMMAMERDGAMMSDSSADFKSSPPMGMQSGGAMGVGMSSVVSSMEAAGAAAAGRAPDGTVLQGPVVLKSMSMNIEAMDVASTMQHAQGSIEKLGGYVENSNSNSDEWLVGRYRAAGLPPPPGPTSGYLQARVPSAKLDAARAALLTYCPGTPTTCRVSSESSGGHDVTEQYVDAVTRQQVDEKALAQLGELLKAAQSVQDVLSVKREMDMVVSRLEVTKAQRKSMESRASLSSLSLSFNMPQPPQPQPPPPQGWTWGGTWNNAVGSLGRTAQGAATVAVYTLVYALPLSILGALLVFVGRRVWSAKGREQAGQEGNYAPLRS